MGTSSGRLVFALLVVLSLATLLTPPPGLATSQPSTALGASEDLQVDVSPLQYVAVNFPGHANVSVLSVAGGVYAITESNANSTNSVRFEPMNASVYQLVLNSAASGANFAYVSKQGATQDVAVSNFSAYGAITLHLTVNSTGDGQGGTANAPAPGGVSPTPFNQMVLEVMGAVAVAAGAYLFVLAVRYRPELSLAGLVLLALGGMEFLGVLPVLGILAAYFLGFAAISIGWKIHMRGRG